MKSDECPRLGLTVVCASHNNNPCCPIYIAEVSGNLPPDPKDLERLQFIWTLSDGKIINGKNTPVIRFDMSGSRKKSIEVKIKVEGLDNWPEFCSKEISLTIDSCKEKKKGART